MKLKFRTVNQKKVEREITRRLKKIRKGGGGEFWPKL
jgi:hypothetical protein